MNNLKNIFFVIILISFSSVLIHFSDARAYPDGICYRTKKTTTAGCGSCHIFGTTTTGTFTGPDTVIKGDFVQYSITITRTITGQGGLDIAALKGTLDNTGGETYLKLLNDELVHLTAITFSNSISINFRYHAPNFTTTDTLFATVNVGYTGRWNFVPEKIIVVRNPTGVENIKSIPLKFELKQNYPNPFNPTTIIRFQIKDSRLVTLKVYNILEKEIATLVNKKLQPGMYEVPFSINQSSGYQLPSGVYFYSLFIDGKKMQTRKMLTIK